jgi:type III secretion system YscQ/HrcQ family protein
MDTALKDAVSLENSDRAPVGDPSVAKLQSRWKSAVKKVSTKLDADVAQFDVDVKTASEFSGANALDAAAAKSSNPVASTTVFDNRAVPMSAWHPVRASQLRKVNRKLARLQQAWLASPICGHFDLNDQRVEWQLSLPEVIINPVAAQISYTPMMVEENAEQLLHEPASQDLSAEPGSLKRADFTMTVGADSFLLNWVPVPWRTLSVDAKHALLQITLAPLVQSLGWTFDEQWHVVGLEQPREKVGSRAGSAHEVGTLSPHVAAPHVQENTPQVGPSTDSAHVLIGLTFQCAGAAQRDTATLRVPQEWLTEFLVLRRETENLNPVKRLLDAHPNCGDIQHQLPVTIGEIVLDAKDVEQLEVGDVFFFGVHHGSIASFWTSKSINAHIKSPSATISLVFEGDAQKAVIRKILPCHVPHRAHDFIAVDKTNPTSFSPLAHAADFPESPMKNASSTNSASSPAAPTISDHLAALPIAITIEVGELSVPLSALSDIAVGTTLSLAKPLDEHLLTIRANGHAIAFGELVMLDSEVGVRVKRLSAHATPNVESSTPNNQEISKQPETSSAPDTAAAAES